MSLKQENAFVQNIYIEVIKSLTPQERTRLRGGCAMVCADAILRFDFNQLKKRSVVEFLRRGGAVHPSWPQWFFNGVVASVMEKRPEIQWENHLYCASPKRAYTIPDSPYRTLSNKDALALVKRVNEMKNMGVILVNPDITTEIDSQNVNHIIGHAVALIGSQTSRLSKVDTSKQTWISRVDGREAVRMVRRAYRQGYVLEVMSSLHTSEILFSC